MLNNNYGLGDAMIKYIYVLVSDEADYYLEQALMSIVSLRIHTPNAFVTLLIDNITEKSLENKRRNILELVSELKVVEIDSRFGKKARSRWLKTSMRQHVEGDFLYIDCDTIICDDLNDVKNNDVNLGAVLESHHSVKNHYFEKYFQNNDKILGFNASFESNYHFNSGVIFCRDIPICHSFFKEWHRLWLFCFEKGILIDQASFNQANYILANVITELDGRWNCQIVVDGAIRYLHNAKIIHYYYNSVFLDKDGAYFLANQSILEDIKKTITISDELENNLRNSKCLFVPNTRLVVVGKFNDSMTYHGVKKIFYSKLGGAIEFIFSAIYKYGYRFFR